MDTEVYMFDLLHDEAVTLVEHSLPGEGDGCAFMKWLTSKLPAVRDAPGQGQLQALVGRHGSIKTHLYLQWVDGRYTPWLWTFRSVDGLHRPSVDADDKKPTRRKGTDNVRQKLPGQTRFHPIRIEDELKVMGVLEKDWQEEPEGQGHYLLADDVPVDDSDDEFLDEMGENANYVVGGTDSIKVVLCASQESVSFATCLVGGSQQAENISDPARREVLTRPPNMHPSSESALELIRKWFNECPRYPTSTSFGRHSFSHQSHPKRCFDLRTKTEQK
ncbi:hypothetical protein QBC32DRAFT_349442 [Pseudoneurospora amorphoporcata]|uniref:Uncharacterized protein n=1 Tax=Pseudoneurospora amorphoporcata TaxID=241081 RepID=A0AAN6NQR0_9PEZI|nr:hypothetical protein QBC32DRAFT_349442 [Pseudoneurospora amorphoporcata]